MHTYLDCPVCKNQELDLQYLKVLDYSVSKEVFQISNCNKCQFKFTNPIPIQQNIGKYYASEQYVSHSDTKKGFTNRLYHYIREITLSQKINLIEKLNQNTTKNLLDIGCGTGYFLEHAQKKGWTISGFEPDDKARHTAELKNNKIIATDIEAFQGQKFDIITMWHVLEHVHSLQNTIDFLKNHLSEKGKIIVAVPNIESWDAKYYNEKWAALDVPRHLYHFSKENITLLFHKKRLKLIKIKGMIFDSFYVSMMSEKYKNNDKLNALGLIKSFIVGLLSNLKAYNHSNHSSLIYIFEKDE